MSEFKELDVVRLITAHEKVPTGFVGTVVDVNEHTNTYEVEFCDRFGRPITEEITVTLKASDLTMVKAYKDI